ncbi:Ankyrin repeat protein [Giardia duodenalis]|uniref:Ankyrin repeat protein n=1 Tax=Giardia intestinalis TaxID=5741 RepID=V6TSC8_GIAIN|nr:Ankyrin repeat protein [Giardia intestinalis]
MISRSKYQHRPTSGHSLSGSRTAGWHQRGVSGNSVSGLDYTTTKAVRGAEQEKEHTVAPLSNAPVLGSTRSATLTGAAGCAH